MHNGYFTFPIGSSYTWVNISKTGSQIFTQFSRFWGSPVDLESVKISGSDSGILREGWEKKFDPINLPHRGSWDPQIFSLGGLPSLYFTAKFHAPATKTGVLGGRGKFLIFLNSNLQHEVWQRACTRANYCFYFILQGTKLAKKTRGQDFKLLPRFGDMASQTLPIFGKFLPKIHVGLVWGI